MIILIEICRQIKSKNPQPSGDIAQIYRYIFMWLYRINGGGISVN